jgi:hypothetical protein
MLELGSSGSVRGVLSNEHPYRHPGPLAEVPNLVAEVGLEHKSSRLLFRKLTPARMGADLSLCGQVE